MTRSGIHNISIFIKKMAQYLQIFGLLIALLNTNSAFGSNTTLNREIFTLRPSNELYEEPKEIARNLCYKEIIGSKIGKTCNYLFPSLNIHKYVDYCVDDMTEKKSFDKNIISSALCELEGDCLHMGCKYFLSKGAFPETRKSYIPPHISIQQNLCPIKCNGICTTERCLCDNNFKKNWMSNKDYDFCYSNKLKDVILLSQSHLNCDITSNKCPSLIHIYGKNFWYSNNLKCKVDNKIYEAIYKSPIHIVCKLPTISSLSDSRFLKKNIKIQVSNDEHKWSNSLTFSYYNGNCLKYSNRYNLRLDSCVINNLCYKEKEYDSSNNCKKCISSVSRSHFTYDYSSNDECGPYLPNQFITTSIVNKNYKNHVFFKLNATNPKTHDDSNNKYKYFIIKVFLTLIFELPY